VHAFPSCQNNYQNYFFLSLTSCYSQSVPSPLRRVLTLPFHSWSLLKQILWNLFKSLHQWSMTCCRPTVIYRIRNSKMAVTWTYDMGPVHITFDIKYETWIYDRFLRERFEGNTFIKNVNKWQNVCALSARWCNKHVTHISVTFGSLT